MLFFVYGTLKKDHCNHRFLKKGKPMGSMLTEPKYTMYNIGGFPGVVEGGNTSISGELYEVETESEINRIYSLEGFIEPNHINNLYEMVQIDTPFGKANMFVLNKKEYIIDPGKQIIPKGVW